MYLGDYIMCYVYILECSDKTLYTGWTNNLDKRMEAHLLGKASKYTRARLPVKLASIPKFDILDFSKVICFGANNGHLMEFLHS
jgi:hypothetical protein